MNFYDKLKTLCKEQNVPITKLMHDLSMSTGTLSVWKNGGSPKANTLNRIAKYFNVSTDFLLNNDSQDNPSEEKKYKSNIIKTIAREGEILEFEVSDEKLRMFKAMLEAMDKGEEK